MMKKLISGLLVTAALVTAGSGCRAHARVGTKHHNVAVGTHAK
jgi:hypothetical protein